MGTKIKCKLCGDIIEGDRKGNLISCKCNACFIDETQYYYRIGGNPEDIMIFDAKKNEFVDLNSKSNEPNLTPSRIDKTNYYLNIAEAASERSTCLKRKYGAIIVNNDEIISTGYNGAPRKLTSCLENNKCLREDSERGTDYSSCISCHAEMNAIISASRQEMLGSILYLVGKEATTGEYVENPAPCSICKRLIINAGIERVYIRLSKTKYDLIETCDWKQEDIVGGY